MIEIMQDAAGVIESDSGRTAAFYTEGVQTCVVSAFECEKATVFVHDSGQLDLAEIETFISTYGLVKTMHVVFPVQGEKELLDRHEKRLGMLKRAFKPEVYNEDQGSPWSTYSVKFMDSEGLSMCLAPPAGFESIPQKSTRQVVLELNNFFASGKAVKLPLDVQYRDGAFLPAQGPISSLTQLLQALATQRNFFFHNLAFLLAASDAGIIDIPASVRSAAKRSGVTGALRFHRLSAGEEAAQKRSFDQYVAENRPE